MNDQQKLILSFLLGSICMITLYYINSENYCFNCPCNCNKAWGKCNIAQNMRIRKYGNLNL
jgi:hypothetical protein